MKRTSRQARMRQSGMSLRFLPMLSLVAVVILIFSFVGISKELIRRYRIQKDIRLVQEEIAALERENEELEYLVEYLNTDSFKEIQARQHLGLKKPGEEVVVVTGTDSLLTANGGATVTFGDPIQGDENMALQQATETTTRIRPARAWWKYFFSSDPSS